MARSILKIDWTDLSEAVPAFLTIVGMPLTYNIAHGLAFGFISYPVLKLLSGKGRDVSWLIYLLGVLLILRYSFVEI